MSTPGIPCKRSLPGFFFLVYYYSMTFHFATDDEITNWDELLLENPDGGNVFSSLEIAQTKADNGWVPRYIVGDDLAILALEKTIPLLGKFWYLPKGPGVTTVSGLKPILDSLKAFAASHGVFVVKLESEILRTPENAQKLVKMGLEKTFAVQPNASTVLIDIAPDLDTVLAGLNQKGRHAIRRAERDGVTAHPVDPTEKNMRTMYDLLKITAEGQWQLRGYEYFHEIWSKFVKNGHGQMFFAEYEGNVVAASFGLILGEKGTYKDGASIRERTAYGSSHLLQWEMIKWMKAHGAKVYDLCGTPPSEEIRNPDHHFAGLARFKTSFNKTVTDYVGCYNLPVSSGAYKAWTSVVERIVLRVHRQRFHTEWY